MGSYSDREIRAARRRSRAFARLAKERESTATVVPCEERGTGFAASLAERSSAAKE